MKKKKTKVKEKTSPFSEKLVKERAEIMSKTSEKIWGMLEKLTYNEGVTLLFETLMELNHQKRQSSVMRGLSKLKI